MVAVRVRVVARALKSCESRWSVWICQITEGINGRAIRKYLPGRVRWKENDGPTAPMRLLLRNRVNMFEWYGKLKILEINFTGTRVLNQHTHTHTDGRTVAVVFCARVRSSSSSTSTTRHGTPVESEETTSRHWNKTATASRYQRHRPRPWQLRIPCTVCVREGAYGWYDVFVGGVGAPRRSFHTGARVWRLLAAPRWRGLKNERGKFAHALKYDCSVPIAADADCSRFVGFTHTDNGADLCSSLATKGICPVGGGRRDRRSRTHGRVIVVVVVSSLVLVRRRFSFRK